MYHRMSLGSLLVLLVLGVGTASAMLTDAQYDTLNTYLTVTAAAEFATPIANGDYPAIAATMNSLTTSPVVILWRPNVSIAELKRNIVWADYAALTPAQQNTYVTMLQGETIFDATAAGNRLGFGAVFGGGSATATALTALAKTTATRFEALFVTADGAANICSVFGYRLSDRDIARALTGRF